MPNNLDDKYLDNNAPIVVIWLSVDRVSFNSNKSSNTLPSKYIDILKNHRNKGETRPIWLIYNSYGFSEKQIDNLKKAVEEIENCEIRDIFDPIFNNAWECVNKFPLKIDHQLVSPKAYFKYRYHFDFKRRFYFTEEIDLFKIYALAITCGEKGGIFLDFDTLKSLKGPIGENISIPLGMLFRTINYHYYYLNNQDTSEWVNGTFCRGIHVNYPRTHDQGYSQAYLRNIHLIDVDFIAIHGFYALEPLLHYFSENSLSTVAGEIYSGLISYYKEVKVELSFDHKYHLFKILKNARIYGLDNDHNIIRVEVLNGIFSGLRKVTEQLINFELHALKQLYFFEEREDKPRLNQSDKSWSKKIRSNSEGIKCNIADALFLVQNNLFNLFEISIMTKEHFEILFNSKFRALCAIGKIDHRIILDNSIAQINDLSSSIYENFLQDAINSESALGSSLNNEIVFKMNEEPNEEHKLCAAYYGVHWPYYHKSNNIIDSESFYNFEKYPLTYNLKASKWQKLEELEVPVLSQKEILLNKFDNLQNRISEKGYDSISRREMKFLIFKLIQFSNNHPQAALPMGEKFLSTINLIINQRNLDHQKDAAYLLKSVIFYFLANKIYYNSENKAEAKEHIKILELIDRLKSQSKLTYHSASNCSKFFNSADINQNSIIEQASVSITKNKIN